MKHLIKKLSIAGGKSKPKPKPATLNPPALGAHQLLSSFSYAEILDLVSDGPIQGLVNRQGSVLTNEAILQGIYLDDTAVAITSTQASQTNETARAVDDMTTTYDFVSVNNFFTDLKNQPITSYSALMPPAHYKLIYARNYNTISRVDDIDVIDSDVLTQGETAAKPNEYRLSDSEMALLLNPHTVETTPDLVDRYAALIEYFNDPSISTATKEYTQAVLEKNLGRAFSSDASINPFKSFLLKEAGTDDGRVKSLFIIDAQDASSYNADSFRDTNGGLDTSRILSLQSSETNHMASRIFSFVVPTLDSNNQWDGTVTGFFLVILDTKKVDQSISQYVFGKGVAVITRYSWSISAKDINYLAGITGTDATAIVQLLEDTSTTTAQGAKYNYSNILAEFRGGAEEQPPFKHFNKVFVDKDYGRALLGPFNIAGQVQRITEDDKMLTDNAGLNIDGVPPLDNLFATTEGSNDDQRAAEGKDYANWDRSALSFNEQAVPVTHIVENPNVDSVFVSLQVNSLNDTVTEAVKGANISDDETTPLEAGSKFPSVVNVRIEIGRIKADGTELSEGYKDFQIIALAESPAIIDIGNPDAAPFEAEDFQYISSTSSNDPLEGGVFTPFKLPSARRQSTEGSFDETIVIPKTDEEETPIKRFVRVIKMSTESNSVLISKDLSLLKITEIIPVNLSYPFSSIIGIKVDSRTFSSIPTRTYECRLKKVQIPANYDCQYPDGRDKRYFDTVADYDATDPEDKLIYNGDWDGTFIEGWTDNPAWVLYDLLTSHRYGLGQYIDASQINKWELYKIARFCDAVDDNGHFIGVADGRGGLEPRYSCNILFSEGTKVFDAINIIAALFRGAVFYGGSEINFLDDRVRDPAALFTNANVKGGNFTYSNYRRDEQFNAIEVVYIDRFDNYKSKVEYIEDEEDISQRGLFKKQVNALGVTSKAMARRIGQHLIYQTIRENQSVTFGAGLETLLCKPGDLIIVEDELKTLSNNFGRILDVDLTNGYLRLDQPYLPAEFDSQVVVYSPTGEQTVDDLDSLAMNRSRLTGFDITGVSPALPFDTFATNYEFSGYATGFAVDENDFIERPFQKQYAVYTGAPDGTDIIFYSTGATGWVFAENRAFTDDATYNKYIIKDAGLSLMLEMNFSGTISTYDVGQNSRRGTPEFSIEGLFRNDDGELARVHQGILPAELEWNNTPQITSLNIIDHDILDYGCWIHINPDDVNYALLNKIPLGSPYRLTRQDASDQIYKIISIREEAPNDYAVIANQYDSGKYQLIESNISLEYASDTFGYLATHQINDVVYTKLDDPVFIPAAFHTGEGRGGPGTFYAAASGYAVTNSTGFSFILQNPDGTVEGVIDKQAGERALWDNLTQLGTYVVGMVALGDPSPNLTERFYDSDYSILNIDAFDVNAVITDTEASYLGDFDIK